MSIYINGKTKEKIDTLYELYKTMISCKQHFLVLVGGIAVGKTLLAQKLAEKIVESDVEKREKNIHLFQFHEGYSYENFVYGLQVETNGNQLSYSKGKQPIIEIIKTCNQNQQYVVIIDDMNRTDIMVALGDLFSALESAEIGNAIKTDEKDLRIPDNLFIIGTMNPLVGKHSIDYAWFRRFTVYELSADSMFFEVEESKKHGKALQIYMDYTKEIFEHVRMLFDYYFTDQGNQREKEKYILGHGLFLQYDLELSLADNLKNLHNRLKYIVEPILEEYIRQGILEDYAEPDVIAIGNIFGNDLTIVNVKPKGRRFGKLHETINALLKSDGMPIPRNALFFFILHSSNRYMKIRNFKRNSSGCILERSEKKYEALDEDVENASKQAHRGAYGSVMQKINGFDYNWISGTAHGSLGIISMNGSKVKAVDTEEMVEELKNNIDSIVERIRYFMEILDGGEL